MNNNQNKTTKEGGGVLPMNNYRPSVFKRTTSPTFKLSSRILFALSQMTDRGGPTIPPSVSSTTRRTDMVLRGQKVSKKPLRFQKFVKRALFISGSRVLWCRSYTAWIFRLYKNVVCRKLSLIVAIYWVVSLEDSTWTCCIEFRKTCRSMVFFWLQSRPYSPKFRLFCSDFIKRTGWRCILVCLHICFMSGFLTGHGLQTEIVS